MEYGNPKIGSSLGGLGAAQYANQCSPAVVSAIEGRIRDLEKLVEELAGVAAMYGVRLQDVCVPQMKGECGMGATQSTPRPITAPLADRLESIHARMVGQLSILREIESRLAL